MTIIRDGWIVLWHQCPQCKYEWEVIDTDAESMEDVEHQTECPECDYPNSDEIEGD